MDEHEQRGVQAADGQPAVAERHHVKVTRKMSLLMGAAG